MNEADWLRVLFNESNVRHSIFVMTDVSNIHRWISFQEQGHASSCVGVLQLDNTYTSAATLDSSRGLAVDHCCHHQRQLQNSKNTTTKTQHLSTSSFLHCRRDRCQSSHCSSWVCYYSVTVLQWWVLLFVVSRLSFVLRSEYNRTGMYYHVSGKSNCFPRFACVVDVLVLVGCGGDNEQW